jgi:N-methylhydantoinase A
MPIRASIDVGGTFTDFCALDDTTGKYVFVKDSTTPSNYADGVINVIRKSAIPASKLDQFIGTGSTMVINALTERKGAKTLLLTTKGFRDVLEIQRSNRTDLYNLLYRKPIPFVPRRYRLEVDERMSYSGEEIRPLDKEDVYRAADFCKKEDIEAVAIAFYNAYANPKHELEALEILKERLKTPYITPSHILTKEWREYERFNTTVLNAYVQPKVHTYLTTLESELRSMGAKITLHIMQSNGGVATFEEGRKTPIYQVESGPIGGVIGAKVVGDEVGTGNIITLDVGGTTAKTSLIDSGTIKVNSEYYIGRNQHFGGYPIKVPVVDIVEIGAGGGSIAWVDELGSLKVGPTSAGADPGPACADRGGQQPTLTDAFVLTGVIDPDYFLGGEVKLKAELAEKAYKKIADKLGISSIDTALGAIEIATANMVNAIKLVSVRRGYDPRDFALVAFGGGGPMFSTSIAEELGIRKVVIGRVPGVFSAWGMLMTDLRHDYIQTKVMRFDEGTLSEIQRFLGEMKSVAVEQLKSEGISVNKIRFEPVLDIRYVGQEHTVATPAPELFKPGAKVALVQKHFNQLHQKQYTFSLNDPLEVVNIRLAAFGKVKKNPPKPATLPSRPTEAWPKSSRRVYMSGRGFKKIPVYERDALPIGAKIKGPAIIEEQTSTTVLREGNVLTNDRFRNLVIEV